MVESLEEEARRKRREVGREEVVGEAAGMCVPSSSAGGMEDRCPCPGGRKGRSCSSSPRSPGRRRHQQDL